MKAYEKNLGRTAISCGDEHDSRNEYPKACIVYKIIDTIIFLEWSCERQHLKI